jgi:hypothetical protein
MAENSVVAVACDRVALAKPLVVLPMIWLRPSRMNSVLSIPISSHA